MTTISRLSSYNSSEYWNERITNIIDTCPKGISIYATAVGLCKTEEDAKLFIRDHARYLEYSGKNRREKNFPVTVTLEGIAHVLRSKSVSNNEKIMWDKAATAISPKACLWIRALRVKEVKIKIY